MATKSVFATKRKEIMRSKHLTELVKHLHDPQCWPLDLETHLAKLSGNGLVLASAVLAGYGRDPEFYRLAEALAIAG
jgi:hypothetical protein